MCCPRSPMLMSAGLCRLMSPMTGGGGEGQAGTGVVGGVDVEPGVAGGVEGVEAAQLHRRGDAAADVDLGRAGSIGGGDRRGGVDGGRGLLWPPRGVGAVTGLQRV